MSYAKKINAIKINISDIEEKEMDKVLREVIAEQGLGIDKSKLDTLAIFIKVRMKMFIEGLIIQIK